MALRFNPQDTMMNKYTIEEGNFADNRISICLKGVCLTYKSIFLARLYIHVGRLAVRPNKISGLHQAQTKAVEASIQAKPPCRGRDLI